MIDKKAGDEAIGLVNSARVELMFDPQLDIDTRTQIDMKLYRVQCYILQEQLGEYINGYQKDTDQKD